KNNPPSPPAVISPLDESEVTTTNVLLVAQPGVDPEGGNVVHNVVLDTSPSFTTADKRSSGPLTGEPKFAVSGLRENTRYYWKVTASAGAGEREAVAASFFVNAIHEPPSPPVIRNPGSGAWVQQLQTVLEVGTGVDPDGDEL